MVDSIDALILSDGRVRIEDSSKQVEITLGTTQTVVNNGFASSNTSNILRQYFFHQDGLTLIKTLSLVQH